MPWNPSTGTTLQIAARSSLLSQASAAAARQAEPAEANTRESVAKQVASPMGLLPVSLRGALCMTVGRNHDGPHHPRIDRDESVVGRNVTRSGPSYGPTIRIDGLLRRGRS
ncbi:MAG TPA: hypothetical protein VGC53_12675 [Vicinamibacteria bacterium]